MPVDSGDGAHQDGVTAVEPAAIETLPVVFDPHRVLAEQEVVHEFFHRAGTANNS